MVKPITNVAASVRQRLYNHARAHNQPFDVILIRYGLERLLYRLSISEYRNRFVLKGGLLVSIWVNDAMRMTRDVNFLGYRDDHADTLKKAFADILGIEAEDGLVFDVENLTAEPIREDVEYGGTRLKTTAMLANARIPITVDIGFGDAVAPAAEDTDYPSLLAQHPLRIRAYPPATVIAEKFQAIVMLGLINSRMKDYYDLWAIPRSVQISDKALDEAITATFARRTTAIPIETPPGLGPTFYCSPDKARQWEAYARTLEFTGATFEEVVTSIWQWLSPSCQRITLGTSNT